MKDNKLDSCKNCRWNETCAGNDSGIFPCPDFAREQKESLKQHD